MDAQQQQPQEAGQGGAGDAAAAAHAHAAGAAPPPHEAPPPQEPPAAEAVAAAAAPGNVDDDNDEDEEFVDAEGGDDDNGSGDDDDDASFDDEGEAEEDGDEAEEGEEEEAGGAAGGGAGAAAWAIRDPVADAGLGKHGCAHYRRRCRLVAPCCGGEAFWCRHCHNAAKDDGEQDPSKRHALDRRTVAEVICALCDLRQPVAEACRACGVRFGRYACLKCNFFGALGGVLWLAARGGGLFGSMRRVLLGRKLLAAACPPVHSISSDATLTSQSHHHITQQTTRRPRSSSTATVRARALHRTPRRPGPAPIAAPLYPRPSMPLKCFSASPLCLPPPPTCRHPFFPETAPDQPNPDCGICRVGGRPNFFHCATCNCCYALALRESHVCVQNAMHGACPVCFEYLFDSVRPITVLLCGHTIHQARAGEGR